MPYYKWQGIDLAGQTHSGKLFAKDVADLDRMLFKQDIAILRALPLQVHSWLPITMNHKIDLLRHLDELLKAGVLLPEALVIVACQPQHAVMYPVLQSLAKDVCEGRSLPDALRKHPKIFDSVTMHMVAAGVESGQLPKALGALTYHLEIMNKFHKKLQGALLMPVCTFIFFGFVSLIILVFIIPQYVSMFGAVNQALPPLTIALITVSNFVSTYGLLLIGVIGALFLFAFLYVKTERGKRLYDSALLQVPYVGGLVIQSTASNFLHAVSLLLLHGVPLVCALKIAGNTIGNTSIAQSVKDMTKQVEGGSSLSRAMMHDANNIFGDDIITIVHVGEESGQMGALLAQAAGAYQDRVKRSLHFITTIAQPLLMIILGLLITCLIFAIYMPIFNLSQAL